MPKRPEGERPAPDLVCPACGATLGGPGRLSDADAVRMHRDWADAGAPPSEARDVQLYRYPAVWTDAEIALHELLDDDDAVSALQILQREGFTLARAPGAPPG